MKPVSACLVSASLLVCLTTFVAGGRGLKQAYPTCGPTDQTVTLDTSQLAFAPITNTHKLQFLSFHCDKLFDGYSRGCTSNSVYTYINEAIGTPPYLGANDGAGLPVRPYVGAYAKPADAALEVKQAIYYLDLQTGSIFVSPPANEVSPPFSYPHYREYDLSFNATNGLPNDGNCVRGGTADPPCPVNGPGYLFYLNEIRSAVQNVTRAPTDDASACFACNPPQDGLASLLGYLYAVLGINGSGHSSLPFGPPLATGPIPAGDVPQW